jgi:DNA-binding beta-propeller fold protein YncE
VGASYPASWSHFVRPRRFQRGRRRATLGARLVLLLISLAAVTSVPSALAAVPTYVETIGGPGHAEMYPSGLDVDPAGNVYVADTGNDQVAAYSPTGVQLWRVGQRGPKTLGQFIDPRDVAYCNGQVFVADTGNHRVILLDAATGTPLSMWNVTLGTILGISAGVSSTGSPVILVTQDSKNIVQVFTPTGTLLATVGSGPGTGNGQLKSPRDAATDSAGNIYIADYANNRIDKFSPTGAWIMNWGTTGTLPGKFQRPYGIDVDANNLVYVADSNNERIQVFTTSGTFVRTFGSAGTGNGQFFQLRRVAVGSGPTPTVYAADLWAYNIQSFTSTGTFIRKWAGSGPPDGLFNEPSGLAVDTDVFVADAVNQRVQEFGLLGNLELMWGHRGWGVDLMGFAWPRDLTANETTGKIWVADTKNSRITEFTRSGVATGRKAGHDGSASDALHWPLGIASVGSDVVVADTGNNRVERWSGTTLLPTWTVGGFVAPNDVSVYNGVVYVADSGGHRIVRLDAATGAFIDSFGGTYLHYPAGVVVNPANGDVWVADTTWNRLVEFTPVGAKVQVFGSQAGGISPPHGKFNYPTKLEISNGLLYVTDQWNDRIEVFALS